MKSQSRWKEPEEQLALICQASWADYQQINSQVSRSLFLLILSEAIYGKELLWSVLCYYVCVYYVQK